MREPFWSDSFDMDLLNVLPDLPDDLGQAANLPLWTHGGETRGRLNHPAVWGVYAYFGTDDTGRWKPDTFTTSQPVIACTWLEALRDAWPHTYIIAVNRRTIWDAHRLWPTFQKLMYDARAIRPLPATEFRNLRYQLQFSIAEATRNLQALLRLTRGDSDVDG